MIVVNLMDIIGLGILFSAIIVILTLYLIGIILNLGEKLLQRMNRGKKNE